MGESLANVSQYLPKGRKIAIITDPAIRSLYGDQFPKVDLVLEIPQGEANKNLQSLDAIFEQLINAEFDRSSFILGIGGGIVCDMSGFIATIFMRGIEFGDNGFEGVLLTFGESMPPGDGNLVSRSGSAGQ